MNQVEVLLEKYELIAFVLRIDTPVIIYIIKVARSTLKYQLSFCQSLAVRLV